MTAKLLPIEVIEALRAGATCPKGWPLQPHVAQAATRCRCCGQRIRKGETAQSVFLSFNDNYAYGSRCMMHTDCDPALAGDEQRHPVAEQFMIRAPR
ncbi:MAG TPA: hypothetical protein VIG97_02330 [Luteimonas sp.]